MKWVLVYALNLLWYAKINFTMNGCPIKSREIISCYFILDVFFQKSKRICHGTSLLLGGYQTRKLCHSNFIQKPSLVKRKAPLRQSYLLDSRRGAKFIFWRAGNFQLGMRTEGLEKGSPVPPLHPPILSKNFCFGRWQRRRPVMLTRGKFFQGGGERERGRDSFYGRL